MEDFGGTGDSEARRLAAEDERRHRTYATLGTVLLLILVLIVILIFWRSCSSEDTDADITSGEAVIESVPGLDRVENAVAIWVRPGEDVDEILSRTGLGGAKVVDLGEGTYVVGVPEGDAEGIVEALKSDPGLFDAGYLFAEEGRESTTTAP